MDIRKMDTNYPLLAKITVYFLNHGWYYRDTFLKKKMNLNLHVKFACCLSCYKSISFEIVKSSVPDKII